MTRLLTIVTQFSGEEGGEGGPRGGGAALLPTLLLPPSGAAPRMYIPQTRLQGFHKFMHLAVPILHDARVVDLVRSSITAVSVTNHLHPEVKSPPPVVLWGGGWGVGGGGGGGGGLEGQGNAINYFHCWAWA